MKSEFPDPMTAASLSGEEITLAVHLLLRKDVSDEAKGRFLADLHLRGETAGELAGFAEILLEAGVKAAISRDGDSPLLELCGTGGDKAGLLNISTAAMFVAAGAGARVAKHGNRAVSSRCGSADVLEALGVALHLRPELVGAVLDRARSVFLLASDFHPAVAAVGPLRRELAARGQMTIFNLLGPLLNPARPDFQLTGVYAPELLDLYAAALGLLGRRAAWAVHGGVRSGEGGFDELSIAGPSYVAAYRADSGEGAIERFVIDPMQLGDPIELGFSENSEMNSLTGGDASGNASRITAILAGAERGAARDMIVLNAAAALHLAGMAATLRDAIPLAQESIDSGNATRALDMLRLASHEAAA